MTRRTEHPSVREALATQVLADTDPTKTVRMELNTLVLSWRQLPAYKRLVRQFQEQGGVFRYGMKSSDFFGRMYMGVEADAEAWLMHELAASLDELLVVGVR